jgi:hypothetical protein
MSPVRDGFATVAETCAFGTRVRYVLPMITSVRWHPDAEKRVSNVPFFVRPFVRRRAERVARERGLSEITSELLDELKSREHTGGKR